MEARMKDARIKAITEEIETLTSTTFSDSETSALINNLRKEKDGLGKCSMHGVLHVFVCQSMFMFTSPLISKLHHEKE
jgi:hypothetical protein